MDILKPIINKYPNIRIHTIDTADKIVTIKYTGNFPYAAMCDIDDALPRAYSFRMIKE